MMDDVAERIRSINHFAPATLKSYLQLTHLTELSREENDSHGYIRELLTDHESIIINLRWKIRLFAAEYPDLGSYDFITGLMEKHEKMAWKVQAHLCNIAILQPVIKIGIMLNGIFTLDKLKIDGGDGLF